MILTVLERHSDWSNYDTFTVTYDTGRVKTYYRNNMPKTVKDFVDNGRIVKNTTKETLYGING